LIGYVRGGFLGVDVFFVLSGFLITCLLVEEHARTGRISLKNFYTRRVLRLFPALWLLLGVCLYQALFTDLPEELKLGRWEMVKGVLMVLCCAGNWAWLIPANLFVLAHAWSLGLEEQFYFVWPAFLALLLRWRVRRRWMILLVAGGTLGAALLRVVICQGSQTLSSLFCLIWLTRADALLAGCLVGLLASWNYLPRQGWARRALQTAGGASGGLLLYLVLRVPFDNALRLNLFTLAAVATVLLIAAAVSAPSQLMVRVLGAAPLAGIGRIAYGLYLWHFPVYCLLDYWLVQFVPCFQPGLGFGWVLKVAASFAAALLSFYLVERPFLRLKERLTTRGLSRPVRASVRLAHLFARPSQRRAA
jgi:peptidoglycan/LPS O-acetylase OafA/YrhL